LSGPSDLSSRGSFSRRWRGIADTGFVAAFGNRDDRYHARAVDIAERITEPLLNR
jgi:hypothetical protein